MTTGERIRYRRQQLGITVRELAEKLGISHAALSKWENNQTKGVSDQHFAALAQILDCNVLWLMGLDDAIKTDALQPIPSVRSVPILGEIACGDPILAVENHDGAANVPADSSADFALRCAGDSMINARIFPGDLVLIRQQPDSVERQQPDSVERQQPESMERQQPETLERQRVEDLQFRAKTVYRWPEETE